MQSFPSRPVWIEATKQHNPDMRLEQNVRVNCDTLVERKSTLVERRWWTLLILVLAKKRGFKIWIREEQVFYAKFHIKRIHFYHLNDRVVVKVICRKRWTRSSRVNHFRRPKRVDTHTRTQWESPSKQPNTRMSRHAPTFSDLSVRFKSNKCEG